jgi:hypothetical protein
VKHLIPAALAAAILAGCAQRHTYLNTGGPHDTSGAKVDDRMVVYLKSKEFITTSHDVLLHATDPNEKRRNFWVVFGPSPESRTPARGGLHSSDTTFELDAGYALVWGDWPIGIDDGVNIGTEGTTFAMQADGDLKRRVYLLKNPTGKPVKVWLKDQPIKLMTQEGTYVEVKHDDQGNRRLSDPLPIAANPETRRFIEAVKSRAEKMGILRENME